MDVRYLEIGDIDTLQKWWKDNRFGRMGIDDLPMVNDEPQGLMVSHNGRDICAGFIIDTTVRNGVMIEYIIADFQVKDRELRKNALNFLIKGLVDTCRSMGKKYAFTSVKNKGLIDRFEDCGFKVGSTGTTEMLISL